MTEQKIIDAEIQRQYLEMQREIDKLNQNARDTHAQLHEKSREQLREQIQRQRDAEIQRQRNIEIQLEEDVDPQRRYERDRHRAKAQDYERTQRERQERELMGQDEEEASAQSEEEASAQSEENESIENEQEPQPYLERKDQYEHEKEHYQDDEGLSGEDVGENTDFENNFPTVPIAVITSSIVVTGLTASNIKTMHHEKQGGSVTRTAVRVGTQVAAPTVVGGIAVGAATLAGSMAALPVTLAVAGAGVAIGAVCGSATLGVTLYYNKFFVARKLHNIEESIKNMPKGGISLAHKKTLIGLINNSLHLLKGEKGKEKSSTKIKKLDPKILFNLNEIKSILVSGECTRSFVQSKEASKHMKKMNKNIAEVLEHSLLFSLLINDIKHIKEIYTRLNLIKKREQDNKNQNIQHILAQINPNLLHNKSTTYDALLERFKREQEYTASKKGKLRASLNAIIPFFPEKKEFVHLHEEVIHLASEINDNYQKLKRVLDSLQEYGDELKLDTSKQQLFDINAAFKVLSYKEAIEKNMASLMESNENKGEIGSDCTDEMKKLVS